MAQARDYSLPIVMQAAPPTSLPVDVLVQGVNALLAGMVLFLATRLASVAVYFALHLIVAGMFALLVRADALSVDQGGASSLGPALVRFAHFWLPAVFFLAIYFELGVLIPLLHPVSDNRYDYALQAIDVWLLGDPLAVVTAHGSRALSDVMTLCYLAYYPFPLILPAVLYARGSFREFQRVVSVLFVALLLAYMGYLAFPALGPHRLFDGLRPAVLDGHSLAGHAYALLHALRFEPPDAFPSGHAMMGILVPALAWPVSRRLSLALCPIGLGMVLATLYLRFHYVADVVAALVLVPIAWTLGNRIGRLSPTSP